MYVCIGPHKKTCHMKIAHVHLDLRSPELLLHVAFKRIFNLYGTDNNNNITFLSPFTKLTTLQKNYFLIFVPSILKHLFCIHQQLFCNRISCHLGTRKHVMNTISIYYFTRFVLQGKIARRQIGSSSPFLVIFLGGI